MSTHFPPQQHEVRRLVDANVVDFYLGSYSDVAKQMYEYPYVFRRVTFHHAYL
jgi:hypothetical protein